MRIADFLRHDAQAYGVPEAPSIDRILEVCVKAANWIDNLEQRLSQAERERDALMYDARGCPSCLHMEAEHESVCTECVGGNRWQWRGVCEENSQ